MNLIIAVIAYTLAAVFLYNGFQNAGIMELLAAAIFTGVGKTYIRRYKEKR